MRKVKKNKAKKRKGKIANVVDSRINYIGTKEDYKRQRLFKDLDKHHYYFIQVADIDKNISLKSSGKILAKDILVYRLEIKTRGPFIRKECILIEHLDHCFIEEALVPELCSAQHSMVEMQEYKRKDNSISYCFCRPSAVYIAEAMYTDNLLETLIEHGDELSQETQISLIERFLDVDKYSCDALETYYLKHHSRVYKQIRKLHKYLKADLESHKRKIERLDNTLGNILSEII